MNKSLRSILVEFYLEYVNDYLTIEKFAEHKEISISAALTIVSEGRRILSESCES